MSESKQTNNIFTIKLIKFDVVGKNYKIIT